ncbi:MAG: hypothetical protein V1867_06620 [Candidatus Falkowbacteria bacterium]
MNNIFIINQTDPETGKLIRSKKVYELNKEELGDYKLIGSGLGISVGHCFAEGNAHAVNFWERVYGYYIDGEADDLAIMIDRALTKAGINRSRLIKVGFFERRT